MEFGTTITAGLWHGTAIESGYGGTGFSTYAKGDLIYASATNTLAKLAVSADGKGLILSSGLPVWSSVLLGDGSIPLTANWNAGAFSITANSVILGSAANAIAGGAVNGGNLTFFSTTHATKGKIFFGTSAYDEVNNRLGIGNTSPGRPIHVSGTNAVIQVDRTANTAGNYAFYNFATGGTRKFFIGLSADASAGADKLHFFEDATSGTSPIMTIFGGNVAIGGTVTPNSTLQVLGTFSTNLVSKSATYTISAQDYTINCTANTFTVTLPTAASCIGRMYVIKNMGTGVITVATTSSQTIDAATTYSLSAQYKYVVVQSNSVNWIIIGNN